MGSFANTLFTILLGWLQAIVSAVWSAFTTENGQSLLVWVGHHWILIAGILCFIGLSADLCIYLIRWKPFRVWKSFFSREKGTDEDVVPERDERVYSATLPSSAAAKNAYRNAAPVHDRRGAEKDEPDLSQWKPDYAEPERQKPAAAEQPPLITNAGYTVPADSPYRRPSVKNETARSAADNTSGETQREEPAPIIPKRRRRINVNELFSNPEEELLEFDAPQDIIDRKKAYNAPVYPRGWKKGGDSGQ